MTTSEYAIDVALRAVLRIKAKGPEEAKEIALAWQEKGKPFKGLTEASVMDEDIDDENIFEVICGQCGREWSEGWSGHNECECGARIFD